MIIQNRKNLGVDSENDAYKVMVQNWSKMPQMPYFGVKDCLHGCHFFYL